MLAIVIPYYKLTFFEATLESIVNQIDKRFNVYIGNDASPEDPEFLLEKYIGKFDFVYHSFENNLGSISLTQQWERCISLTENEEWIMILGDDDVLGENVVKTFFENLEEIEKEGINVVRFATQVIDEITNTTSKVFVNPKFEKATDFFYRRYLGLTRSSLSEHIFRKEKYLKYSFKNYPLAWHSDDYAWVDFSENKPIFAINEAIVLIKVSNESLTGMSTNLIGKNIAESLFYWDLIMNKLNLFDKEASLQFLLQSEVSLKKNRKLILIEWISLFVRYINNYSTLPILKFLRRFLISFKK